MKRTLLTLSALLFLATAQAAPRPTVKKPIPAGGFKNCKAANAAGYGDIKKGHPAYHTRLDRDRDGTACEWSKWRG